MKKGLESPWGLLPKRHNFSLASTMAQVSRSQKRVPQYPPILPSPSKLGQLSGHRPQLQALPRLGCHGTLLELPHHGLLMLPPGVPSCATAILVAERRKPEAKDKCSF